MRRTRGKYDLAYACFLIFGSTLMSLSIIRASYTDAEWAGGAGGILLILLPLILASFAAILVAVVLSVGLEDPPLLALTVTAAAPVASFVGSGSREFDIFAPIVYGVAVWGIFGLWFVVLRKRYFPSDS
jgi:hypothetical protein